MKWLALLFLVVSAKGLNGLQNLEGEGKNQEEDDQEKISILKVNPKLIIVEWIDGAETFPPPTIENGDSGGPQFRKDFDRVAATCGYEVNNVIYQQGLAVGQNLINDIVDGCSNLVNSTGRSSNTDSECNIAQKDLEYLVNKLKAFLDLKPGNQTIEYKPLPELPNIPTPIVSQTKNRTASDFFLHYAEFNNEDLSTAYGYMAGVFLRGWYNSRKYLDIQQLQYRNQILNNAVLPAYRNVVEKVFRNRAYIEGCVSKDTWSSFENYGSCTIKLSNEWLQTLAELEQHENGS